MPKQHLASAVIVTTEVGLGPVLCDDMTEINRQRSMVRLMEALAPRFDEVIIVAADPMEFLGHNALIVRLPQDRPTVLGAIQAGLSAARHPQVLMAHCSKPFLEPAISSMLMQTAEPRWDVVMVQTSTHVMPFTAVYHKRCLKLLAQPWATGQQAAERFLKRVRVKFIDEDEARRHDPDLRSFVESVSLPDS